MHNLEDLLSPRTCTNCGSSNLEWHSGLKNMGRVQDGMLRLNEISAIFFLGCADCSETLVVLYGDEVARHLNAAMQSKPPLAPAHCSR